jgi:hypothetical protein
MEADARTEAEAALAAVKASLAAALAGAEGGTGSGQAGQLAGRLAVLVAATEQLNHALGALPAEQAATHAASVGAWLAASAGQVASLLDRALAEAAAARASSGGGAREWLGLVGQAAWLVVWLDRLMMVKAKGRKLSFWTLVKADRDLRGPRRVEDLARLWPSADEVGARGHGILWLCHSRCLLLPSWHRPHSTRRPPITTNNIISRSWSGLRRRRRRRGNRALPWLATRAGPCPCFRTCLQGWDGKGTQ